MSTILEYFEPDAIELSEVIKAHNVFGITAANGPQYVCFRSQAPSVHLENDRISACCAPDEVQLGLSTAGGKRLDDFVTRR